MNTLIVHKILDRDMRLNYNSDSEFARKVGISKQRLSNIMKTLSLCKEKNSFNTICTILERAGYEITITKKEAE